MMLHVAHFEFVTCLKCERIELSDSTGWPYWPLSTEMNRLRLRQARGCPLVKRSLETAACQGDYELWRQPRWSTLHDR